MSGRSSMPRSAITTLPARCLASPSWATPTNWSRSKRSPWPGRSPDLGGSCKARRSLGRWPRTLSGATADARLRQRSNHVSAGSRVLQASSAAGEEAAIAELLLGQVVVPVDHLVEEMARCALGRAVGEGALVAVLETGHVKPAGGCDAVVVRVSDQLIDF